MFSFITNKPFWVNLLVSVLLIFAIFFGILQLLGVITNHGEYLKVPSVLGKNTNEAIRYLEEKGFDVAIQDSVFTDTAKMGIVLKQLPEPNSTVKINRTVLLTINRVTLPLIDMPALEGKTLNFALEILRRSHLKLGDTIFQPDFMKGSVLSQQFRGDKIAPGSKLPWGSSIDLIIGSGLDEVPIPVPDLFGLTFEEAKILLEEQGILLGAVFTDPDVIDTLSAFVWKQMPPLKNELNEVIMIKPGQLMDLWLSLQRKSPNDSLKLNQP